MSKHLNKERGDTHMPRWPLLLIAAPAAVAVWSGWVGLGAMSGFGVIQPLPGIWDGLHVDTAVTLPVGVEAYAAFALGAWLAPGAPEAAKAFARRSAVGALCLGMAGQVIYHLLAAAGRRSAPWPVVILVSCLPVLTLGMAAALAHLLRGPRGVPQKDGAAGAVETSGGGGPARAAQTSGSSGTAQASGSVEAAQAAGATRGASGRSEGPVGREALVAELVAQIREAAEEGREWRPDYPTLIRRSGRSRSSCERIVRTARTLAEAEMVINSGNEGSGNEGSGAGPEH